MADMNREKGKGSQRWELENRLRKEDKGGLVHEQ